MSQDESPIKPADLRGILKYVPMFRDHVFVIAFDGSIVEHENFANTITDIAVMRSLNIKVVLVHGIGKQLRDTAARAGATLTDFYGEGPTDIKTLALAREASAIVSQEMLEALSQAGMKCAMTNAVRATEVGVLRGKDMLLTGKVEKVDTALLKNLIALDVVPLVSPVLSSREGKSLRVNSDELASELAQALGASKLIYLTPHAGLTVDGESELNLSLDALRKVLASKKAGGIEDRLLSKARCAVRALDGGVARAHILDGRILGGLLTEIFDKVGLGTMIHANAYEQIRPAKKKDARAIHNITKQGAKNEQLVQRTLQYVEQNIEDYFVFEIDESVIGCARLRQYPGTKTVEIGTVYVQPFYQGKDVGRKLVEYGELAAAKLGANKLLALTTQAYGFFHAVCEFTDGSLSDLPAARRAELKTGGRNSKILFKKIVPEKKKPVRA
jgi:amino-acid N-acetyltransferase